MDARLEARQIDRQAIEVGAPMDARRAPESRPHARQ
jgi:hypothetical protein